jgi:hypothetical protein
MGTINIWSKRKNNKPQTSLQYEIPQQLRVQIIHIWQSSIGPYVPPIFQQGVGDRYLANEAWDFIHSALCREYGIFSLTRVGTFSNKKPPIGRNDAKSA